MSNPNGRPSTYTQELAKEICTRIASGESVRQICRDESMPAQSTVYLWLLNDDKKDFSENYIKARAMQAEVLFDEMLEIADDASNDWVEKELRDGRIEQVYDNELVNRSRLRIDTRKWYLSKVLPKKFGDKLDVTSAGEKLTEVRVRIIERREDVPDSSSDN